MPFDDRVLRVEMLIKEFRIRKDDDRLYTVESVEIEAPASLREASVSYPKQARFTPPSGAMDRSHQMGAKIREIGQGCSHIAAKPSPRMIGIFDDVLTTGHTFVQHTPCWGNSTPVSGLWGFFVARRVIREVEPALSW